MGSYGIFIAIIGIFFLFVLTTLQPVSSSGGSVDVNRSFLDLNDTPDSYLGQANKVPQVNSSENALVFTDINGIRVDVNNGLCTVIVATTGGDFNTIPAAVDSLATTGGRVCIRSGTYQLTRAIDINSANLEIWGAGTTTNIRTNPISIPTAIKIGDNAQHSNIRIKNLAITASSNLGNGLAIDASNFAIGHIEDVWINGYNRGIDFNKSNTFYNMVDNVRISVSGVGSFGIRFNNGSNDNTVMRTRIITDGNGTGVLLAGSHGNSLYETNVESGSAVGIDVNTTAHDTTIIAPYLESNIINLRLASGVESTTLIGGTIQSGTSANIQNNGAVAFTMLGTQVSFNPSRQQLTDVDLNGTLCLNGDCKSAWPSGGSGTGRTYTSGTPATIQVDNDLNTISQNFDGNFNLRFSPAFDTNFQKKFDGNFQISFDGNYYPRNALLFPVPDANIASDIRYKQDSSCDNNTDCVITGRINTIFDANVGDVNGNTYRVKSSIGLRGDCGYSPFSINGVPAILQFDCSDGPGYVFNNVEQTLDGLAGGVVNTQWTLPRNTNPAGDTNHNGALRFVRRFSDGNQFLMQDRPNGTYYGIGQWQSNQAPDFNLNKGKFRGDINVFGVINFDLNVLPDANNTGSVGSQEKHVANIYGVNIFTGDLIFANGMYLHEFDENNTCLYSKAGNQLTCFSENSMTSYRPIVQVNTGNKPVCDDSIEGMTWFTKGALGVASKNEVCVQTALNNYLWVTTI